MENNMKRRGADIKHARYSPSSPRSDNPDKITGRCANNQLELEQRVSH